MSTVKKVAHPESAPRVRQVRVDSDHTGQRLDNFLISQLKGVPKTHIYRLLRRGEVRINKGRSRADYRIQCGDIVRIPPVRMTTRPSPDGDGTRFAWLEDRILYEDAALLAVDKPAGLAVHGGSGVNLGLIEILRCLRPRVTALELVHRLDRDTSGCLLVAKKRSVLLRLHAMLRDGEVDKRYQALLCGNWAKQTHTVTAPLRKQELRSGERRVSVDGSGKASATRFRVLRRFRDCGERNDFAATLVEIELLTGRTHQARVHAAHAGHPIAGDEKYGDRECNAGARALGLRRLFLHAARLQFEHPADGHGVVLEAPMPAELAEFLHGLDAAVS